MKTNYQSNSHKSKRIAVEDKKKVDKIVKGKVKTKKKNGILSSFINNDLQDIKKYIVEDVLIPTIKKINIAKSVLLSILSISMVILLVDFLLLVLEVHLRFLE